MVLRLILVFILSFTQAIADPVNVNDEAPDWSLLTPDGETINYYDDSSGKVSMVLYWATWCPYCKSLMPHLEVIYRKYRSKGLKFYAINIREDGDPVKFYADQKYTSTLLLNGDEIADAWGVKATPGIYVIDKDHKVIYKRPNGVNDVLVKQNIDLKIKYAIAK